jgi:hypothetical protein
MIICDMDGYEAYKKEPEGGLGTNLDASGKAYAVLSQKRTELRASENLNCPEIAPHVCSDSRHGKGRIVILCNPCRNADDVHVWTRFTRGRMPDVIAGQPGKQEWMIYFFRGSNDQA